MQPASDTTDPNRIPARLPKEFELEGYVVDGWLRDGGMAAIYRGRRASDERRVAIKLQLPHTAQNEQICAHFDLEAEAMRRVAEAPQVVDLLAAGVLPDGRRYFVLEWVDGDNLEDLVDLLRNRDQRLPISRACWIGCEVARGLAAMHAKGLVHRDLKPANVMVMHVEGEPDVVKLVDFGIVADLHGRADKDGESSDRALMGTSAYMPPEQRAGKAAHPAFDIYSLGLVMFEALSGHCVPPDDWTPETLPRVDSLRRRIPKELAELVHSCIRSDPGQRPGSAGELAEQLGRIAGDLEAEAQEMASQELPVRSGGTEIVPAQVERSGAQPQLAPGGTEISLTHQEVLSSVGMRAPLYVPLPPAAERGATEAGGYGGGRKWVLIGGPVVLALALGAWVFASGGSQPEAVADGDVDASINAETAEPRAEEEIVVAERPNGDSGAGGGVVGASEDGEAAVEVPPDVETPPQDGAPDVEGPPAVEPEPEPEPVTPPSESKAEATPNSPPTKPKPDKKECDSMHAHAATAKKARDWQGVLDATKTRTCWSGASRIERKRLRVEAYAEQGNFARCLEEAGKSQDREISARARYCEKKVEG